MNYQQAQARELYFGSGKTQREIAQAVGVHEKTVYRWIKQDAWEQLKQASLAMPVIIADNMCNQLIELQNSIAEREEGKRIPSMQEAEIMRKLVNCVTKLKDHPSLGQNIQMMMSFSHYIGSHDLDFNKKLMVYANGYFKGKAKNGCLPIHFDYGTPPMQPSPEEVNNMKEELEDNNVSVEATNQTSKSFTAGALASTTCVRVSGVEPSLQGAIYPQEKIPTQPDISKPQPVQTITQQATQPTNQQNTPCPTPDKAGHSVDKSQSQNNISSPLERPEKVIIPPYNVIWLGRDEVFDPTFGIKREIKNGEIDWLYRNGYTRR
jgi:transposase-like protein